MTVTWLYIIDIITDISPPLKLYTFAVFLPLVCPFCHSGGHDRVFASSWPKAVHLQPLEGPTPQQCSPRTWGGHIPSLQKTPTAHSACTEWAGVHRYRCEKMNINKQRKQ